MVRIVSDQTVPDAFLEKLLQLTRVFLQDTLVKMEALRSDHSSLMTYISNNRVNPNIQNVVQFFTSFLSLSNTDDTPPLKFDALLSHAKYIEETYLLLWQVFRIMVGYMQFPQISAMIHSAPGVFLDTYLDQDLVDNANIRLNSLDIFSSQNKSFNLAQLVSIQNLVAKLHKAGVLERDG